MRPGPIQRPNQREHNRQQDQTMREPQNQQAEEDCEDCEEDFTGAEGQRMTPSMVDAPPTIAEAPMVFNVSFVLSTRSLPFSSTK